MPSNGTVRLGPWGGEFGTPWNYPATGSITRITISSDNDVVHSISFISRDQNGNVDRSSPYGTPMGPSKEINIDPRVEKLVLMEGKYGVYNSIETVTQLSFTVRKNGATTKHGPYGSSEKEKGTNFSCQLSKDPFSGFHGLYGPFLNSIGISVVVPTRVVIPSWGGYGGAPWSFTTKGQALISHIFISYGDVIRAIRFTSVDSNGQLEHSQAFGDSDPKYDYHEIEIETTKEKLNGITGTYGTYNGETMLTSLSFTTNNRRTFGPFGTRMGDAFDYTVGDEETIAGFHGRGGALIDAIGVYKRPSIISTNGVLLGRVGATSESVEEWAYQPKGLISRIIISFSSSLDISSICFESKDELGNITQSPIYGLETGTKHDIIIGAKAGKLNGISGTTFTDTDVSGPNIYIYISSLSFSTDKKIVYGPYGSPQESHSSFSFPVKDGFISGFHGTKLKRHSCLRTLGVYANPT